MLICLLLCSAYPYFISNFYTANAASIRDLLANHLKLACLSTVNKRINALYYINFRKNNLCSEVPTTINKKKVSTFNVTKL